MELSLAMKVKLVLRVLALVCVIVSLSMLPPFMIALYDGTGDALPFFVSMSTGIILSCTVLILIGKPEDSSMGIRDGVGITGFSWILASLTGALPYWFSGSVPSYTDAFFETMSGFTTTGATIFSEIEVLPRGILLWRSLTHWIGGMGIIVLSLAVLPFLGVSGMAMYRAEVPGVTAGKVTPRLHQTAARLWGVYVFMTLTETVLLMFGGMNLFDAFCHSCSTIATGGFSTKNDSVAYFNSSYIEWVIIIFMFLSGVNFSLYFLIPKGKIREILEDEELRCYAKITVTAALLVAISLYVTGRAGKLLDTLRRAFFAVISLMTTTGFITENFDIWPEFCRFTFVILMFIGASGGSTGGGFKVSRIQIIYRQMKSDAGRLLHPRAVITPRMNGRPIPRSTIDSTSSFLVMYLLLATVSIAITAALGVDLLTAIAGVITCISNVGPGLEDLGAVKNFGWLPDLVKWLFSFCMLAGRLELFAVFLLFVPETYSR